MSFELHHGDCLEVMKLIPDASVDAIITDPPYGVDLQYNSHNDSFEEWKNLMHRFIPEAVRIARGPVIIPTSKFEGEQYIYQNFSPIWRLCWFKGASCTRSPIGFKDWEVTFIFGSPPPVQVHDYFTAHANRVRTEWPEHPCPKPLDWALWLVSKMSKEGQTVLDPFMGSGTTGVASVKLNRRFIGIEKDSQYFHLAEQRIIRESSQGVLFMEQAA
jgi:site-specific DNA-methyltransferase (adenine-specific)